MAKSGKYPWPKKEEDFWKKSCSPYFLVAHWNIQVLSPLIIYECRDLSLQSWTSLIAGNTEQIPCAWDGLPVWYPYPRPPPPDHHHPGTQPGGPGASGEDPGQWPGHCHPGGGGRNTLGCRTSCCQWDLAWTGQLPWFLVFNFYNNNLAGLNILHNSQIKYLGKVFIFFYLWRGFLHLGECLKNFFENINEKPALCCRLHSLCVSFEKEFVSSLWDRVPWFS